MKTSALFYSLLIIISFCLTSCDPDDSYHTQLQTETVKSECCGEQGDLPSEPGDDDGD